MWSSKYLTSVKRPAAASIESPEVRVALKTLRRLRGGWRPPEGLLADARQAERWSVTRQTGAAAYQFIGTASQPISSSLTIATVLALDPAGRWALLFSDRWIRLGEPLPEMPPFDAAEIAARAEQWLLSLGG